MTNEQLWLKALRMAHAYIADEDDGPGITETLQALQAALRTAEEVDARLGPSVAPPPADRNQRGCS